MPASSGVSPREYWIDLAVPNNSLRWSAASGVYLPDNGLAFPLISGRDLESVAVDRVYWDAWPLLNADGGVFSDHRGEFWFALSAPRSFDPDERHARARIHGLRRHDGGFSELGPVLPDGFSPGSREWSGSATFVPEGGRVILWFTAAGRRGEPAISFEQRIFASQGLLAGDGVISGWSEPSEVLRADGTIYRVANQATGEIGKIKAFRDPEFFRDPAGGGDFLTFTASSAANPGMFDGLIGIARLTANGTAEPLDPLVDATGFNNELERPHLRVFDGRCYLFWSTQAHVFAPGAGGWPTGLYGAVADRIEGPWRFLNGSGLVAGNPPGSPAQAYSWLVLPDRTVTSFVDRVAGDGAPRFVGAFAPFTKLHVNGDAAAVVPD